MGDDTLKLFVMELRRKKYTEMTLPSNLVKLTKLSILDL